MVKKIFLYTLQLFLIVTASNVYASKNWYSYDKRKIYGHLMHIVTIDPMGYDAFLVKANDGKGRETVDSIAKRHHAEIAINGGFFSIGENNDGIPTRTLVIDGHKYATRKNVKEALVFIKKRKLSLILDYASKYSKDGSSLLSGIPFLVKNGKIDRNSLSKESPFYGPRARTAIGKRKDGTIVLVVAEHQYSKSIGSLIQNSFMPKIIGLTMLELADLMSELGCVSAINLDGGGSSTLWVNGAIMNVPTGDGEKSFGKRVYRPVSDAVIFKKKVE